MNTELTISEYIKELSSSSPTPGGGNVSALCGALSVALSQMVCSLTIGKKKYAAVEEEMQEIKKIIQDYPEKFLSLASKDNEAFDLVMEAFKLPKFNPEEITLREEKIEEATLKAAEIPARVIKICAELIDLISKVAAEGNRNSVSDAGVSALLISSAAQGAYLNVLINCSSLKDREKAGNMVRHAGEDTENIKRASEFIVNNIISGLK